MIRAARRSFDDTPEVLFETETGPRAFTTGDRITFTRNDTAIGVKNGMLGTVVKADAHEITVHLDTEGAPPRKISFNPNRYHSFDHGYATTIHKSQEATVERAYVLASKTMDEPLTYVAMTRHRDTLKLYTNAQDRPTWIDKTHQPHLRQTPHQTRNRSGPKR